MLADSLTVAPDGPQPLPGGTWSALIAWGDALFGIGLYLALPVLAAMLAVNIAMGVLMRAAPQINLLAIGFPLALLVGMLMLALMIPFLAGPLQDVLTQGIGLWSHWGTRFPGVARATKP